MPRLFPSLTACLLLAAWIVPAAAQPNLPPAELTVSYVDANDGQGGDPFQVIQTERQPTASGDRSIGRLTFWPHQGTTETLVFTFASPVELSSFSVYWYDDRPGGGCNVPRSWSLEYQDGYNWTPVETTDRFGVEEDASNRVTFKPVVTTALRLKIELEKNLSGGLLQLKINDQRPQLRKTQTLEANGLTSADQQVLRGRLADRVDPARPADESVQQTLLRLHREKPDDALRLAVWLDWLAQDWKDLDPTRGPTAAVLAGRVAMGDRDLVKTRDELLAADVPPDDGRWLDLYIRAGEVRRAGRLDRHDEQLHRIVFTKHHDIGGQHYAYTEDVSDSPYNDNNPFPHSGKLCLLTMDGPYGTVETLVDEPDGLVRDPDVSYDGRRILFARRTSMTEDDYHLYEMDAESRQIRQITSGPGAADYEGIYLPSGDILFNSSRCQQIVDCWWSDVSNLYTCDADGRYLRRLSFDQVHTNYPQMLADGRVCYTRWDYNDRGQLFPQPLFQMNPDGTGQTEFYGNNSWFPTTILHARGIPGTKKVVCVLSGHHTYQKGKLAIIDPTRGRQEAQGVQLIAPVRLTEAVRIDQYGHDGEQFQYPFPLSETEFLVTYSPEGSKQGRAAAEKPFGVYWMDIDGRRELLAADPTISCNQGIPLAPRPCPPILASRVDYRQTTGTYFLQDIYEGPGLAGVQRGTVKRLRVVALEFRAAGVGSGRNSGPAGGALVSTPISINGAWDVKRVLGEAEIYADGSAAFTVPARTPVYFQAIDAQGDVVQTMRSWSTLQPGERFSCVGCHEEKDRSPTAGRVTEAMRYGPLPLEPTPVSGRGFSFPQLVQPILDRHCVKCHNRQLRDEGKTAISLEPTGTFDAGAQKTWSDAYQALADRKFVDWVSPQSAPPMLPPYSAGAAKSPLMKMLREGHEGVKLSSEELRALACWIDLAVPYAGDYTETMPPKQCEVYNKYLQRRIQWAEQDSAAIEALLQAEDQP